MYMLEALTQSTFNIVFYLSTIKGLFEAGLISLAREFFRASPYILVTIYYCII